MNIERATRLPSYDEHQMDTERRICPDCGRDLYLRRPFIRCYACREKRTSKPAPVLDINGVVIDGP